MEKTCVAILLASYNGEKFIGEQIESILKQLHTNFKLWIRDDCSTDNTPQIIKRYAGIDDRIIIVGNNDKRLGAQLNFGALMQAVAGLDFEYYMFSDQDDVWFENKVSTSLKAIEVIRSAQNPQIPVLLHTDFQYTDSQLNAIKTPDNVAIKLSSISDKTPLIVNDNYIFGCTIIINSSLLKLATPISADAENHDFWIALYATTFGEIYYLNEKTMFYRQHDNNVSGGLKYSSWRNRLSRLITFDQYVENKRRRVKQLAAFVSREKKKSGNEKLCILDDYVKRIKVGGFSGATYMVTHGFRCRSFLQTVVYFISVLIDRNVPD